MTELNFPDYLYELPTDECLQDQYGSYWQLARKVAFNIHLRTRLSEAQNHRCCYCTRLTYQKVGKEQATIEHVIPRSRGGPHTFDNTVMACRRCNNNRKDKPITEEALVV